MTDWFYQRGEAQFGPLSTDQLKAVWQRGHLADDTLVRRHGAESWEPISHADLTDTPPETTAQPAAIQTDVESTYAHSVTSPPPSLWTASIAAIVIMLLVCLAESFNSAILFHASLLPGGLPDWAADANLTLTTAALWLNLVFFGILIVWQATAYTSLGCVYERGFMKHGPWSGFWWITPFAHLFKPFICLYELQDLSRSFSTKRRIGSPSGKLLWSIEITLTLSTLGKVALLQMSSPSGGLKTLDPADVSQKTALIVSALHDITLAVLAACIGTFILIHLSRQIRLYRERYP